MPRLSALARFPLVLCLCALTTGCSDQSGPAAPLGAASGDSRFALMAPGAGGGPPASLRNIWPNEDGRSWTYRLDQGTWDIQPPRTYATREEVPPAPSLDEVAALLGNHPIGNNPVSEEAGYRMEFQGMRTTESGAVGQNLVTEVFELGQPSPAVARAAMVPGTGFWRSLARARPDLAERIATLHPEARSASAAGTASVDPPLYLFGYAWEKTREYIGSYGDLNTNLSWKYLEADLDPGHEFTIQLIPDLTDDVFLHVRVLREQTATSPLGDHPHSIDVLYMVNYGLLEATDELGNPAYSRAYDYGTITYAPKVGPVASYERSLIWTGEPLDPGYRELSGELTAVVPGKNGPLP